MPSKKKNTTPKKPTEEKLVSEKVEKKTDEKVEAKEVKEVEKPKQNADDKQKSSYSGFLQFIIIILICALIYQLYENNTKLEAKLDNIANAGASESEGNNHADLAQLIKSSNQNLQRQINNISTNSQPAIAPEIDYDRLKNLLGENVQALNISDEKNENFLKFQERSAEVQSDIVKNLDDITKQIASYNNRKKQLNSKINEFLAKVENASKKPEAEVSNTNAEEVGVLDKALGKVKSYVVIEDMADVQNRERVELLVASVKQDSSNGNFSKSKIEELSKLTNIEFKSYNLFASREGFLENIKVQLERTSTKLEDFQNYNK